MLPPASKSCFRFGVTGHMCIASRGWVYSCPQREFNKLKTRPIPMTLGKVGSTATQNIV